MCESSSVMAIRDDIEETLKKCEEIDYNEWLHRPLRDKVIQWVLKLFAPIL